MVTKGKKTKKEKIVIVILVSTIVVLALVLGYDMYISYRERTQAREEISSLNVNVNALI